MGATFNGYGKVNLGGKTHRAHRAIYEREVGPVEDGLQLDHLCRNRACVNPAHLEPVTRTTNLRRGNSTKLTRDEVSEIRGRLERGDAKRAIARDYEITPAHVRKIAQRKVWREVEAA